MHVCGFGKMLSDLLSEKCHSPFTQPEEGKNDCKRGRTKGNC